ncbi:hypothetical protein ABU162_18315 [Paenibacillus thiaminolyticus]|uniref:hypothetical protein n=1 Tax=Paenibacillus thiaminolyticus TaxID=49283 RepID=UPI0035A574CE
MVVVILMCSGSFRTIHNYMNGLSEVEGEQLLSIVDPEEVYQFHDRFQADTIVEPIAEQVEWMTVRQSRTQAIAQPTHFPGSRHTLASTKA